MRKAPRDKRTKTQADIRLERFRAVQSRPVPSGTFREMQGIPVTKREVWEIIKQQNDFLEGLVRVCGLTEAEIDGKHWQEKLSNGQYCKSNL